ncbi:hypothetical protein EW145_g7954 [Phellinidium pouzarii]|uniref:Uncharacterized protein n=1 Tax=Phellinidium pouzarii TaxID=167371 RepID=A0A4S4KBR4_9AGAM|nr:hypothetical protein EW145_g7954 [Phellinidium pouzarii]
MKPMTSLSISAPWHAHAHTQALALHFQHANAHRSSTSGTGLNPGSGLGSVSGSLGSASEMRMMTMPATPYTPYLTPANEDGPLGTSASASAVPDYFTASHSSARVPPLEAMRGLPTYEDSEAQMQGHLSPMSPGSANSEGQRAPVVQ